MGDVPASLSHTPPPPLCHRRGRNILWLLSPHLMNNLNNFHHFFKSASWLCHISRPCSFICPSVINANNKRHCNLVNRIPKFGKNGIIIMIWIRFIISEPRVVLQCILKTCVPFLTLPQWFGITLAIFVPPLFVWNFISVHAFVRKFPHSLELLSDSFVHVPFRCL